MRFSTWNIRSLYKSGSLWTVARELVRYKLDLMGVQEVTLDERGPCKTRRFFLWKRAKNHNWDYDFLYTTK
jgi:hypothetical protein